MVALSTFLTPQHVALGVRAPDKAAVLSAAGACLAGGEDAPDGLTVASLLGARERIASTGVGAGIAIPHACHPGLQRPRVALLRMAEPVEFDAADGQPVELVVALLAPAAAQALYLRLLARIARVVRTPSARRALLAAAAPDEVVAVFEAAQAGRPPEAANAAGSAATAAGG